MNENQQSVGSWIDQTFPGTDPESPRKAMRALEEMIELCLAAGAHVDDVRSLVEAQLQKATWKMHTEWHKVPAEAADVLIVLYGVAYMRGFDLHAEVDRKMVINRARRWKANGDGTGYHIKETTT